MRPHKFKQFSQAVAERHGLRSETVELVARSYFLSVQRKLSSLDAPAVDVPGLGVFTLRVAQCKHKVLKVNNTLNKIAGLDTVRATAMREVQTRDLGCLTAVLHRAGQEAARKTLIQQQRHEKPDSSPEAQRADS